MKRAGAMQQSIIQVSPVGCTYQRPETERAVGVEKIFSALKYRPKNNISHHVALRVKSEYFLYRNTCDHLPLLETVSGKSAWSGVWLLRVSGLGSGSGQCPLAVARCLVVASAADVSRDQQWSKTKNSSDDGGRRPHRQPQPTSATTCMEGSSHQPHKTHPY